jgi:hypothetical protein
MLSTKLARDACADPDSTVRLGCREYLKSIQNKTQLPAGFFVPGQ